MVSSIQTASQNCSTCIHQDCIETAGVIDSKIILVAEDDDINYLLIEEVLSETNFQIVRANNGKEAVEICASSNIWIVLMDIKMPIMDGYQALKIIHDIKPNLNVIAQTSYALQEDALEIKKAGFNGYITKPISQEKLIQLLESYRA